MDFNQVAKLIELFISFVQVIFWPIVILVIVFALRTPLRKFIDDLMEVNLKAGPFETTARRKEAIEAAVSLGAATAYWQGTEQGKESVPDLEKARNIARVVEQLMTPATAQEVAGASVLWVDDRPMNNTYERQALEALGIQFTISKSTEDALERLEKKRYDLIISDMSRPPDLRAGYTLLEQIKARQITTPFIIYASGKRPEHIAEARKRGAFATTNEPQELFEYVVAALKKGKA